MHPGPEADPNGETRISWNTGDHRRKFLKSGGTRLDENREPLRGDIVFWGEWEPESKVVKRLETKLKGGPFPRYIYKPYYVNPKSDENYKNKGLQNTDPFVFGGPFRYSLCQQPHYPSLRNLEKGSVILFGSRIDGRFALDTVFVVSDDVEYNPQNCDALLQQDDETYKIVTVKPILAQMGDANNKTCVGKRNPETLRSYWSATYDKRERFGGMFSFFPCQAYAEDSLGFTRPTIRMRGLISDKKSQGIKNTECSSLGEIHDYWNKVVEQVTRKCSLGIFAKMPTESKVNTEQQ